MKRCMHFGALVLLAASLLMLAAPVGNAGRVGGPMTAVSTAPAGQSVYYDISFAEKQLAVVSITGNGRSLMFILIYDADGHVTTSTGRLDRQTATIDVYRTGVFRVEVRNLGVQDNTFTLTTN